MTYEEFDKEFYDEEFKIWLKERMPENVMKTVEPYLLHLLSLAFIYKGTNSQKKQGV